jgi:hypothetical protein
MLTKGLNLPHKKARAHAHKQHGEFSSKQGLALYKQKEATKHGMHEEKTRIKSLKLLT